MCVELFVMSVIYSHRVMIAVLGTSKTREVWTSIISLTQHIPASMKLNESLLLAAVSLD